MSPPPGPSPPGPLSLPPPPSLTGRGGDEKGRGGATAGLAVGRAEGGVRDGAVKGRVGAGADESPLPFLLPPPPVREGGWGRERRAGVVRAGREGGSPASAESAGRGSGAPAGASPTTPRTYASLPVMTVPRTPGPRWMRWSSASHWPVIAGLLTWGWTM